MIDFIVNLIKNNLLATLIMSFFPLIELKGGIVFARGVGYSFFEALGISYLGSTIAFFPIFFLLIPVLKLLKKIKFVNKFALSIEKYIKDKAENALKDNKKNRTENFIKAISVFIFVAIPLPMTGVWMGTAIAVFLGMKFKDAILPITIGNLIAGIIISLLAEGCILIFNNIKVLDCILYGLFGLAIILLGITIIKIYLKGKSKKGEDGNI